MPTGKPGLTLHLPGCQPIAQKPLACRTTHIDHATHGREGNRPDPVAPQRSRNVSKPPKIKRLPSNGMSSMPCFNRGSAMIFSLHASRVALSG